MSHYLYQSTTLQDASHLIQSVVELREVRSEYCLLFANLSAAHSDVRTEYVILRAVRIRILNYTPTLGRLHQITYFTDDSIVEYICHIFNHFIQRGCFSQRSG